jgi:predicted nucleic acid-binding protein
LTIIVDTSVIVKWLVEEDGHTEALLLLNKGVRLACPDLALPEVANVLRRKVRAKDTTQSQAAESLARFPKYFDLIVPSAELLGAGFALAEKVDHSVYDCMFLALARRELDAVVVTTDRVFLKKCVAAGFSDSIRHLEDFAALTQAKPELPNG